MKKLINESEAVGKVVEKVHICSEYVSTIFDDGTALLVAAGQDWDGCSEVDVVSNISRLSIHEQRCLGIITEGEEEELYAGELKVFLELQEREERAEYERLKQRLENEALQEIVFLLMEETERTNASIPGDVVGLALHNDIELFRGEE